MVRPRTASRYEPDDDALGQRVEWTEQTAAEMSATDDLQQDPSPASNPRATESGHSPASTATGDEQSPLSASLSSKDAPAGSLDPATRVADRPYPPPVRDVTHAAAIGSGFSPQTAEPRPDGWTDSQGLDARQKASPAARVDPAATAGGDPGILREDAESAHVRHRLPTPAIPAAVPDAALGSSPAGNSTKTLPRTSKPSRRDRLLPVEGRLPAKIEDGDATPAIRVTIGRVEVHAPTPPRGAASSGHVQGYRPALSLSAYLASRRTQE
jgi:hypothetical protein